jgi:N-methylhydantoinase B
MFVDRARTPLPREAGGLQIRSDRRAHLPYGLHGGSPGTPSSNVLNPGPDEVALPTHITRSVRKGDVIRHVTAGGGGFGDPLGREPAHVLDDVLNGKHTAEHVRRAYGVVIDPASRAVDEAATRDLRREARSAAHRGQRQARLTASLDQ